MPLGYSGGVHELWSSTSYEAHLLSLPFALAPAAMLTVIAYTAVMRGAPVLRGFLLLHFLSLLPYATVMMLSPSITSPAVAEQLFQLAVGFVPLAAAVGCGFQRALIGRYRRRHWFVWLLIVSTVPWIVVGCSSGLLVSGVKQLSGFWFPIAGPWAWLLLVHTILVSIAGVVPLAKVALTSKPSDERRQLRAALVANLVSYSALADFALAYGIGVFPFGWLLSGIGSVLVVRALLVEDLLRVRAVDTTAPVLVVHFVGAVLLGWLTLAQIGEDVPWWGTTLALVVCFVGVRNTFATASLINRGARGGEGPLERLLAQLVGRARTMREAPAIAQVAIDIIDLGIGVKAGLLLASEEDWGWESETGARLADDRTPDPLLMGWLAEERRVHVVFADDLEVVPVDLQDTMRDLLVKHAARAVVLARSADEVVAMIVVPAATRRLRGSQLAFLDRVAERLSEALLHARMAQQAGIRARLAREVELAATVQGELLPGKGPHVHGDITVVGSWQPATRCAGDFWGVYPLGDGRVLVAIGDVTGHGVASAMVTAAAVGACDVCVQRPQRLELDALVAALDAAVRRIGGGELGMTCFAAILDPAAREIQFVSCGHTAPYLCRPTSTAVELHALVARGNPLGAGIPTTPRVQQRPLQAGDLVVWYTDGVIEAQDPVGRPFGDRRLQHLLKKLDRTKLAALAVHDLVQAGVAAHRSGHPLADDETVVVAQLAVPVAASLARAHSASGERGGPA
ncbi:MAG: protein serine/threonine phosphatase [Deltaproteobacteria bacterium]|nr:protein serine/threonine phosphatase [Deltaproteobacteria bacterium]